MNLPDKNEVLKKEKRIRGYLEAKGYDAMIIGRQDNFAWLTDGGTSKVISSSETGFSLLVITQTAKYLISQVMDGKRVMDEELAGLDFEYIPLWWYECTIEEKAMKLLEGCKVVSDINIEGAACLTGEIYHLHYPLTDKEIQKLRWLGARTEECISKVVYDIVPGMEEYEIEARLLYELAKNNISTDVLLVGSDERISKYRHPNPSNKKVDKYIMLHPVARKWGLHANVTRLVYFGDCIPQEILRKYNAASQIEAAAISMCKPGVRFCDILRCQQRLYMELGFEEEWRNHFQGGITGYMVADATLCRNPENVVMDNQAYDWFITITGTKVEELSVSTAGKQEVLSVNGYWPAEKFAYNGVEFDLPIILRR